MSITSDDIGDLCFLVEKLVDKLEAVQDDPEYTAIWQLAHARTGKQYSGPQYGEELREVKKKMDYIRKQVGMTQQGT